MLKLFKEKMTHDADDIVALCGRLSKETDEATEGVIFGTLVVMLKEHIQSAPASFRDELREYAVMVLNQ